MSTTHDDIAQDMFGVFEQDAQDVVLDQGIEGGGVMFNPNAKDAEEQTWRGVIKFLPNLNSEGMKNHTIKKVSYRVDSSDGSSSLRWDSPLSVGEECIVSKKYWELKNSKNAMMVAKSNNIKFQPRTFALIQVIRDMQDEKNNGKIMVWSIPQAVEKRINEQMYPSKKDIEMGSESNNVFNPLTGYPMALRISVENVERDGRTVMYRNYDSCAFQNKALGVIIEGEDKPVKLGEAKKDREIQTKILETIKNGANLQDYAYVPPTDAQREEMIEFLDTMVSDKPSVKKTETKEEVKTETKNETKNETKEEVKAEAKTETKEDVKTEAKESDGLSADEKMMMDLGMGDDL